MTTNKALPFGIFFSLLLLALRPALAQTENDLLKILPSDTVICTTGNIDSIDFDVVIKLISAAASLDYIEFDYGDGSPKKTVMLSGTNTIDTINIGKHKYTNQGKKYPKATLINTVPNPHIIDMIEDSISIFIKPIYSIESDTAVLIGDPTSFKFSIIEPGSILNSKWLFGDGDSLITYGHNNSVITHVYPNVGEYEATVTHFMDSGCVDFSVLKVKILSFPEITTERVCKGLPTLFSINTPIPVSLELGDGKFLSLPQGTYDTTHTYDNPGSYLGYIHILSRKIAVPVEVVPYPVITGLVDTIICTGISVPLKPEVADPYGMLKDVTYFWSDNYAAQNRTVYPVSDTSYTLMVNTPEGCAVSQTVNIKVIQYVDNLLERLQIPQFFTPNNDGVYDTWGVTSPIESLLDLYSLEIFDHRGNGVFESSTLKRFWDGTYEGKPLPVGTYYYLFMLSRLPDNLNPIDCLRDLKLQLKTGSISLLR